MFEKPSVNHSTVMLVDSLKITIYFLTCPKTITKNVEPEYHNTVRVRTLFGTKNSRTFQGHSRAQFQFFKHSIL